MTDQSRKEQLERRLEQSIRLLRQVDDQEEAARTDGSLGARKRARKEVTKSWPRNDSKNHIDQRRNLFGRPVISFQLRFYI